MQIEMKGINKAFGGNPVLQNAGFVLADGEIHALMEKKFIIKIHGTQWITASVLLRKTVKPKD